MVRYLWVVAGVSSTIPTAIWFYGLVRHGHQPLNYWLVFALGLLLVSALIWGFERGHRSIERGLKQTQNFYGPVTVNVGHLAPGSPTPVLVTPSLDRVGRPVVDLFKYVERPSGGPPVIRNRLFQNAVIRGPIMISLGSGTAIWSRVTFRVALLNGKPEEDSILFEVPEDSLKVAAAVALENCIFEDCETENVGLVGTRRQLNEFLEGVRNS